jgi:hypothetical protein
MTAFGAVTLDCIVVIGPLIVNYTKFLVCYMYRIKRCLTGSKLSWEVSFYNYIAYVCKKIKLRLHFFGKDSRRSTYFLAPLTALISATSHSALGGFTYSTEHN